MDGRVLLIVLIGLAAAAWWWPRDQDNDDRSPVADSQQADYTMSDFRLSAMNVDGRLGHTLAAQNLYHYAEPAQSTLTQPRMEFFEGDRPAWKISAERGVVLEEQREVVLSGEVEVRYAGETPARSFEIHTNELHVWPDDRRARSDEAVRIVQQSGVVNAIGMSAELDRRQIQLESRVRGYYEP
jgi:lipopolysaccharide export system protein LptC